MDDILETAVSKLTHQELKALQRDLGMSKPLAQHLVDQRLEQMEQSSGVCSVCGGPLQDSPKTFTLIFGPDGLKKKSSLCALDCLEYFVNRLKSSSISSNNQVPKTI